MPDWKITYMDNTTEAVRADFYQLGNDNAWLEFLDQYTPNQVLLVRASTVQRVERLKESS